MATFSVGYQYFIVHNNYFAVRFDKIFRSHSQREVGWWTRSGSAFGLALGSSCALEYRCFDFSNSRDRRFYSHQSLLHKWIGASNQDSQSAQRKWQWFIRNWIFKLRCFSTLIEHQMNTLPCQCFNRLLFQITENK